MLAKLRDRLTRLVAAQRSYRPLYYNLGDETGIADLAAFWDFDFSRGIADRNAELVERALRQLDRTEPGVGLRFHSLGGGQAHDNA